MQRKWMLIGLFLAVLMLTGCTGKTSTAGSQIEVGRDGKITAALTESFDKEFYQLSELEDMLRTELSEYNTEAGSQRIELKSIEEKEGTCTLVLDYASWEDYAQYNQEPFFAGTVKEAGEAGVDLNVLLMENGKDHTIGQSEITELEAYHLVAWNGSLPLHVPGKIRYYSEGITLSSAKDAVVQEEAAAGALFYIIYK